ncbi:hypothetical protein GQ55_5G167900 [Panicum hallii var. hallii]|uniref:Membrane-associated kinase regulator 6 n=1 Tax=Panicum hallii var. hallii TaxID=1504633 RepID=A0A2T7DH32_9POAL|nr:hypothetical protein GQ55_5G167900 [Panicum hallii var. hallii]
MDHAASHPVPDVGSFSYSWPTSKPERQPEERLDHAGVDGSIATDPASASQCSFDFRLSPPQQTADAGQMFLDGLLLPLQLASRHGQDGGDSGRKGPALARSLSLDSSQRMVASAATSSRRHRLPRPASQTSSPCGRCAVTPARSAVFRASKLRLPSFGRCGKRRKWMSFRLLAPLCRKIARCVWRRKAMDVSHRTQYGGDNVKLCDSGQENAIRDAILHCKRSL